MAYLRDMESAAHHPRPLSPGRRLGDSLERWIEQLEFDMSLSAKLWANFLMNSWPVSDTGKAAHVPVSVDSKEGAGRSSDLFFPLRRGPQRASASIRRQIDRWVNEGGAIGAPANDVCDQQVASSKESTDGCVGD